MKRVFQIFFGDVKRLSHNIIAMIVVIGVCIIPSLYAWFNIAANYDPYSNTREILVAVANKDKGSNAYPDGGLYAGNALIENLKQNHDLGWVFVSEEEAISGVESGRYYAAMIIPEDFSSSLLSIVSGKLKQPAIKYYLNEKKNAIAPKVTDTGATTIQNQINETFIAVASETIAALLKNELAEIRQDADSLQNGTAEQLEEIIQTLYRYEAAEESFEKTASQSQSMIDDAHRSFTNLTDFTNTSAETIDDGLEDLNALQGELNWFSFTVNRLLLDHEQLMAEIEGSAKKDFISIQMKAEQAEERITYLIDLQRQAAEKNQQMLEKLNHIAQRFPSEAVKQAMLQLELKSSKYLQIMDRLEHSLTTVNHIAATTESAVKQVSSSLDETKQQLETIGSSELAESKKSLDQAFQEFSLATGKISGIITGMEPMEKQMDYILEHLEASLSESRSVLKTSSEGIGQAATKITAVKHDLSGLTSAKTYQALMEKYKIDEDAFASFMASPVELKTESLYPVKNYGSAITPFYTNLAIWVSGIVLIAIFKLEIDVCDRPKGMRAAEGYFGRWLLFVTIGLIQALVICLGDLWILQIQCEHPILFITAGLFISFIYINLIYALSITFKHIGKAICVILVILQIPGSAGTYPIEMTSGFFQHLHPFLPFTYGINVMREAVAGIYGNDFWRYMGVLALFLPLSLLIGLCIRPAMINLNRMFDLKLKETGLMICEEGDLQVERVKLSTFISILSDQETFRQILTARMQRFEMRYETRKKRGFLLMLLFPTVFFLFMLRIQEKMIFLILWILSMIGISAYLIILEFFHDNLKRKFYLSQKTKTDLINTIQEGQEHQ